MPLKTVLAGLAVLLLASAPTHAATDAACDVQWQITPQLDAKPRHLAVSLSFDAGARSRSSVLLPSRWAGADDFAAQVTELRSAVAEQSIDPVTAPAAERTIRHRPGDRVVIQYQVGSPLEDADDAQVRSDSDAARTRLGARWFQAFGRALLLVPGDLDDKTPQRLCVDVDGLGERDWWIGSLGAQQGRSGQFRTRGAVANVLDAVYLGGDLQVRERRVDGKPIYTVMPPAVPSRLPLAVGIDGVADRAARLSEAARRFWRDPGADMQLLVLHPNHSPDGRLGSWAVPQGLVMHASDDLALPSARFDDPVMREWLRAWIPDRFGPLVYTGRSDATARYWLTEGFNDYFSHRILLNSGLWTLEDFALVLNRKLDRYRQSSAQRADNRRVAAELFTDPEVAELPGVRGELLAHRWNSALRSTGHLGLDTVMRQLMLPASQAQREGPLSKPLITHRLLAALRGRLGETPLQDLANHIEQGLPFELNDSALGPCLRLALGEAGRYVPVSDGLLQPRCRAWAGIGGDASDPTAGPDQGDPQTVMVCQKVRGKKAKVCKSMVVKPKAAAGARTGTAKAGTAKAKGGKARAGATTATKSRPDPKGKR